MADVLAAVDEVYAAKASPPTVASADAAAEQVCSDRHAVPLAHSQGNLISSSPVITVCATLNGSGTRRSVQAWYVSCNLTWLPSLLDTIISSCHTLKTRSCTLCTTSGSCC